MSVVGDNRCVGVRCNFGIVWVYVGYGCRLCVSVVGDQ